MNFNVNELLSALSFTLDYVEQDLLNNVTNHGRRVAYIASRTGQKMKMTDEELFDLISYSLLHDNGVTKSLLMLQGPKNYIKAELTNRHCVEGEKNIVFFPFFVTIPNVILYHHEQYDGSGFFGVTGEDIPLYSRIIALADYIAIAYSENKSTHEIIHSIKFSKQQFDPGLRDIFYELSQNVEFWLNMNDTFVNMALHKMVPHVDREFNYRDLRSVSQIFSNIIDDKSPFTGTHSRGISEKTGLLCKYYGYKEESYWKMRIAADLHDLGKIMIPNDILDKPSGLNQHEIEIIQSHTFYTRKALEMITGFEEIADWAASHHEKLNGKGYPYGFDKSRLDFKSRLLACVDIYQALTEERPYRHALSHNKAVGILRSMANQGLIDAAIVEDISVCLNQAPNVQAVAQYCNT